jgi:membrane protein implicated in regulation of membrane protease activity
MSFDSAVVAWVALAVVAGVIEVSIPHFGVIFVSLAAGVSALVAAAGFGPIPQWVVFAIALGASLALLRPRLLSGMGAPGVPSRTDGLLGREGIVTHDIETSIGAGRVNVGGEDWAARATAPLRAGTRVRVVKADGIVLEVTSA